MADNTIALIEIFVCGFMLIASFIVSLVLNIIRVKKLSRGEHVSKGLTIISIVLPIYSVISILPVIMLFIYML